MTADEQQQVNDLQERLKAAQRAVDDTRAGMSLSVDRVATEARLYRSLFWSILTVAAFATLLFLLQQ